MAGSVQHTKNRRSVSEERAKNFDHFHRKQAYNEGQISCRSGGKAFEDERMLQKSEFI